MQSFSLSAYMRFADLQYIKSRPKNFFCEGFPYEYVVVGHYSSNFGSIANLNSNSIYSLFNDHRYLFKNFCRGYPTHIDFSKILVRFWSNDQFQFQFHIYSISHLIYQLSLSSAKSTVANPLARVYSRNQLSKVAGTWDK